MVCKKLKKYCFELSKYHFHYNNQSIFIKPKNCKEKKHGYDYSVFFLITKVK